MGIPLTPDSPDSAAANVAGALKYALQPPMLLRSLFASATIWLLIASALPSYSRLIFSGPLAGYFAAGLAMVLVSQIITMLLTAFFSSDHATQVVSQSPTAVIQGSVAASVIQSAPADMPPDALFALVYLVLLLASALTAGFLLLLGAARAGDLIRYIPYPIIGGFMAGLGWLILNAGFRILVGLQLRAEALPQLLAADLAVRWLPALFFALFIIGLRLRVKSVFVVPGVIIAALCLFYAWALTTVGDAEAVAAAGWLLPDVSGAMAWQLPDFSALSRLEPAMLIASGGHILTLIVVCALNLFLRAGTQEIIVKRELDFNRECLVNGAANFASALAGGGVLAYHAPISSALVTGMRVYGRLVGVMLALMFALTLLIGGGIFALIPRFIPAGLLMYFGLQFMKDWLVDSWTSLPRQDYIVVLVIALVTALFGLLAGIAVGIAVAILFFVLEYSRMDVLKQEFSGSLHRSALDRSFAQSQLLQREGDAILIFRLQGFVFFGTAYRFYEHVKRRVLQPSARPPAFIILDFKAVRGFDVSAIVDFQKLKRLADKRGIKVLVSNVLPHLQPYLLQGGIVDALPIFDDLDHALEQCENTLLRRADLLQAAEITVAQQLAQHVRLAEADAAALRHSLERIDTAVGDIIFQQGDAAESIYFIEAGRVDVLLGSPPDRVIRLRSMTAGTVIGEIGFYLDQPRSASVVVTEAGALQRLSHQALSQMEESAPQTASAIHIFIARILSERLSTSNRLIQELLD